MKESKLKSIIPLLMLMVSFGLITGCGNKKSGSDEMSNDSTMAQKDNYGQGSMDETSEIYAASLDGKNEVPAVETDARGSVKVTINGDSVHVQGRFTGLSSQYAASHIHKGAEGDNGAPIQPLSPEINNDKMSGSFDSSYKMNAQQLNALKNGDLYINVHSKDHPKGEIRGQLEESGMDNGNAMDDEDSSMEGEGSMK